MIWRSFNAVVLLASTTCIGKSTLPKETDAKIPVSTQWTLDATGPSQRAGIRDVMLLVCPVSSMKGTGFLIDEGFVVTNNHVLQPCKPEQLIGTTSLGQKVSFSKAVSDEKVDLALLKPVVALKGGLHLANTQGPGVGVAVSTWGFPLGFNGPSPILSSGYLAGFTEDGAGEVKVKHLVINGSINGGNSGGPLFVANTDRVIGIVVAKYLPFPPYVQHVITVMSQNEPKTRGLGLTYTSRDAAGKEVVASESQVVAQLLQEFYNDAQIGIGEAIDVSELKSLLAKRRADLQ